MTEIFLIIFFISVLLFFLGSGIWVAISMIGVSTIGMMLFTSRPVGDAMATTIWGTSSSWTLTALPLFVWMGEILFRTKLSENLFAGLSPWMQKLPGGLIHVNVVGCALFAAISGSSAATVATVGKMSIPELRKRNYPESFLLGTLAGSGTLGLLIPPSIILIIYGVTVEESIAKLFIAGIIPGIGLAILFMIYVVGWSLSSHRNATLNNRSIKVNIADEIQSDFLRFFLGFIFPLRGGKKASMCTDSQDLASYRRRVSRSGVVQQ